MPGPSATTFQRPDLGILFEQIDAVSAREGFIAQRVLPFLPVALQSAPFPKTTLADKLRDVKTRRAPGAPYNRIGGEFTQDSYATEEHGLEEPVDERELRMFGQSLNLDMQAVERLTVSLATEAEKRAAAAVFNTSTWTGSDLSTAVGVAWSNTNSSTPLDDVAAALVKLRAGGVNPLNARMIADWVVLNNLRRNTQIKTDFKYAGIDDPTMPWGEAAAIIAKVLGVKEFIVAGGIKNTANRGLTASISGIWSSSYCMIAKIAETRDLRETCIGRTFAWEGDGAAAMGTFEEYREEQSRSNVFRARHDVIEKILYSGAGHLLSNIT